MTLYAFTGPVPDDVIETDIASTLRIVGADNYYSRPISVPSRRGLRVTAASAGGEFVVGGQRLRSQYSAYLVQREKHGPKKEDKSGRGALIEHNIFIAGDADSRIDRELIDIDDGVHMALKHAVA